MRSPLNGKTNGKAIQEIAELKVKIDDTRTMIEQAERSSDLQRASELRYGVLPGLERELGGARADRRGGIMVIRDFSRRKSVRKISPKSFHAGLAFR